jgi:GNAT superfamily N-acetyltransferase
MAAIVCLCGKRIDARDTEALVAAFMAHTDLEHGDRPITEERRREVVDAIRRTGGWSGEREHLDSDIEIRPLSPALKDDYLAFFDGEALADNPVWGACYCLSYQMDLPPAAFEDRTAAQNRADKAALIERGEASGVLAYAGGRVAGWCHAAPRTSLPALDRWPDFACDDPETTGAIVCFVVAPRARGRGLAQRLLEGACDMLRDRGFRAVEAYPAKAAHTAAGSYHGRIEMYRAAGFDEVRASERFFTMRKTLT